MLSDKRRELNRRIVNAKNEYDDFMYEAGAAFLRYEALLDQDEALEAEEEQSATKEVGR